MSDDHDYGCEECGEVQVSIHLATNGRKLCGECGGTALDFQEAMDRILELKQEVRIIRGEYD